ncbi:MAG: hypothetical protein H3Z52_13000 [archaeon]|nr:hypothetical protein [archaeon]
MSRWKVEEAKEVKEEAPEIVLPAQIPAGIEIPAQGGLRIILKNVKITAEKIIVRREKK